MLRCASLVGNENAQWAMWVDDATRTQIGTQSKAELVSQSFLPSFLPFIRSSFLSLPPHELAEGERRRRRGGSDEQLAAAPLFFVPGEKRTVKRERERERESEREMTTRPHLWFLHRAQEGRKPD